MSDEGMIEPVLGLAGAIFLVVVIGAWCWFLLSWLWRALT